MTTPSPATTEWVPLWDTGATGGAGAPSYGIPGEIKMWPSKTLPTAAYGTWVWADGASYSATTYPEAAGNIDPAWKTFGGLADPGAGNFRVPDLRGLSPHGLDQMPGGSMGRANRVTRATAINIATLTGEEYHTLAITEIPSHNHGAATGAEAAHTHTFTTGTVSADHSHSGTTATENQGHVHYLGADQGTYQGWPSSAIIRGGDRGSGAYTPVVTMGANYNYMEQTAYSNTIYNYTAGAHQGHAHTFSTGGISTNHTHSGTTAAGSSHSHTISAQGGGGAHENLPPTVFVPYIVRIG